MGGKVYAATEAAVLRGLAALEPECEVWITPPAFDAASGIITKPRVLSARSKYEEIQKQLKDFSMAFVPNKSSTLAARCTSMGVPTVYVYPSASSVLSTGGTFEKWSFMPVPEELEPLELDLVGNTTEVLKDTINRHSALRANLDRMLEAIARLPDGFSAFETSLRNEIRLS